MANEWFVLSKNQEYLEMSGRTATHRHGPSFPARILVEKRMLRGRIFDWGCGRGLTDVNFFIENGFEADGWDPIHAPDSPPESFPPHRFDWVHCAYVINTIPNIGLRNDILKAIVEFLPPGGNLSLAVRSESEIRRKSQPGWEQEGDGWITCQGTFQKGFTVEELTRLVALFFDNVVVISREPILVVANKK